MEVEEKDKVYLTPFLDEIMQDFYNLAEEYPSLLFKIRPDIKTGQWVAGFSRFGYWWEWEAVDGETLGTLVQNVIDAFDTITKDTTPWGEDE